MIGKIIVRRATRTGILVVIRATFGAVALARIPFLRATSTEPVARVTGVGVAGLGCLTALVAITIARGLRRIRCIDGSRSPLANRRIAAGLLVVAAATLAALVVVATARRALVFQIAVAIRAHGQVVVGSAGGQPYPRRVAVICRVRVANGRRAIIILKSRCLARFTGQVARIMRIAAAISRLLPVSDIIAKIHARRRGGVAHRIALLAGALVAAIIGTIGIVLQAAL